MKFTETPLKGAYVIELEQMWDERGFFARSWCVEEFRRLGLEDRLAQCNVSFNEKKGTLRGLHYQETPYEEVRLVRCTRGRIWDVIVDLRDSEYGSFGQWFGTELSCENYKMMYVPKTFAHGFITLSDSSEVFYQMSESYRPDSSRGIHWNDPSIAINWPIEPQLVSKKDSELPFLGRLAR